MRIESTMLSIRSHNIHYYEFLFEGEMCMNQVNDSCVYTT